MQNIPALSAWTISGWVQASQENRSQYLVSLATSSNSNSILFGFQKSERLYLSVLGQEFVFDAGLSYLYGGEWFHFACTWDSQSGQVFAYLVGVGS